MHTILATMLLLVTGALLRFPQGVHFGERNVRTTSPEQTATQAYYSVRRVIDGDTIVVDMDGTKETVRLIGINTPETVDPRRPVQCFGKEASLKASAVLSDTRVRIETDPSQGERDKYGRLLAYVFLADGTSFNRMMVSEGYAYEYTYNTPYKYQQEFKQAQKEAQASAKGLWAPGVCTRAH